MSTVSIGTQRKFSIETGCLVKMLYMVQHIADNWVIVDQLGNLATICKCISAEKRNELYTHELENKLLEHFLNRGRLSRKSQ